MSNPTPPNLGNVITSPRARKIIYGGYAGAALTVGAAAAYFIATGEPLPQQLVGAQGVIAFLGVPIGALALTNTPPATGVLEAVVSEIAFLPDRIEDGMSVTKPTSEITGVLPDGRTFRILRDGTIETSDGLPAEGVQFAYSAAPA